MIAATWTVGETAFVAFPDEIMRVRVVEHGDGGRHFKLGYRPADPIVVLSIASGEDFVVGARELYSTALAASIRSAELGRKAEEE